MNKAGVSPLMALFMGLVLSEKNCAKTAPNLDQSFSYFFPADHCQGREELVKREWT